MISCDRSEGNPWTMSITLKACYFSTFGQKKGSWLLSLHVTHVALGQGVAIFLEHYEMTFTVGKTPLANPMPITHRNIKI